MSSVVSGRHNYQLEDSTPYFFGKIDEIGAPGYAPTVDDTLRVRVRTTGIVEHNLLIDDNTFQMYDVGGQRSERKKWIHCFENVTAMIFVNAMSGFDQMLFEDSTTNRITESLQLFDDCSNSEYFESTSILLFLNKSDLFMEKIKKKNMSDSPCEVLQQFEGDNQDFEETSEYLTECFLERYQGEKTIYHHVTCATDTSNVQKVFEAVKDIIINAQFAAAGLE